MGQGLLIFHSSRCSDVGWGLCALELHQKFILYLVLLTAVNSWSEFVCLCRFGKIRVVSVSVNSLLCLKTRMVEPDSRAPSTREAWFNSSLRIRHPYKQEKLCQVTVRK